MTELYKYYIYQVAHLLRRFISSSHMTTSSAGNHYVLLIKNQKIQETTARPAGYIMKPGINNKQTEVMDLSTSSSHYSKSQENEPTYEEPSLLSKIKTLDHTYVKNFEECEAEEEQEKNPDYSSHISSQSTSTSQEDEIEIHCDESANNTEYYEEISDVDEPPIPKVKKGKPFPTYLWDNLDPIECAEIPKDINSFKKYIVHTSDDTWQNDTANSRYFELKTSS